MKLSPNKDQYLELLNDPADIRNAVSGLEEAVNALTPNVRKLLRYFAKGSLDPYEPTSVETDFAMKLDAYLKKHDESYNIASTVSWKTILNLDKTSGEIYDQKLLERIEKGLSSVPHGVIVGTVDDFVNKQIKNGVVHEYQKEGVSAVYGLTPDAREALRALRKIKSYPWMYPLGVLDKSIILTEEEKKSKTFLDYKRILLQVIEDVIEGKEMDLKEVKKQMERAQVSENSLGL